MPEPLRVQITNAVLLNGGDAAIVDATIESLSALVARPVDFTVYDQQPDVAQCLFPSYRVRPWPWHVFRPRRRPLNAVAVARAYAGAWLVGRGVGALARVFLRRRELALLREYAQADLAIAKGGTYLVPQYRLAPHLFDFRLCSLLGVPLVLASQSVAPVEGLDVLCDATVYVRDERSRAALLEKGLPSENIHLAADTAFATADPEVLETAMTRALPPEPRVCVSVRSWPAADMEAYRAAIAAIVTALVRDHGARVTFLSTCQGVPEYVDDDSVIARQIAASLPDDVATEVDDAWNSPAQLRERLATFDLVVATRLHAAILALSGGVPVFPIAYEFKTDELFRQLGLEEFVQDIATIEGRSAVAALERFLAELPSRRGVLFERVAAQRASALAGLAEIAAQLERA